GSAARDSRAYARLLEVVDQAVHPKAVHGSDEGGVPALADAQAVADHRVGQLLLELLEGARVRQGALDRGAGGAGGEPLASGGARVVPLPDVGHRGDGSRRAGGLVGQVDEARVIGGADI